MIDEAKLAVLTDEELARQPFDELVAALQRTVQALEAGTRRPRGEHRALPAGPAPARGLRGPPARGGADDHRARAPRRDRGHGSARGRVTGAHPADDGGRCVRRRRPDDPARLSDEPRGDERASRRPPRAPRDHVRSSRRRTARGRLGPRPIYYLLESGEGRDIGGLVVDDGHRSAGIGAELLAAAEAWARESGATKMVVRSRVARERAHRFYEREGYASSRRVTSSRSRSSRGPTGRRPASVLYSGRSSARTTSA